MRPGINKIKVKIDDDFFIDGVLSASSEEHLWYTVMYEVLDVGQFVFMKNVNTANPAILPYVRKVNEFVTDYIDVKIGDSVLLPYLLRSSEYVFEGKNTMIVSIVDIIAVHRDGKYKCYNGNVLMIPDDLGEEFSLVENGGKYYKGIDVETGKHIMTFKIASRLKVSDIFGKYLVRTNKDYICAEI